MVNQGQKEKLLSSFLGAEVEQIRSHLETGIISVANTDK